MGLGPDALHTGRGGRMSGPSRDAGCPGAGAGYPGWQGPASVMGRRISGSWAGCSAARDGPYVRADLVQLRVSSVMGAGFPGVGPDVRAGAGCPEPVAAVSSSFSFLCFRARLALVLGFSMVSSGVPEYEQGPCLK